MDGLHEHALFTIGLDACIASWHPGLASIAGYDAQEAVGLPLARLYTPDDQAAGLPAQELALAGRCGEHHGRGLRRRKDGSVFEAAVVLTGLRGATGETIGYLAWLQDLGRPDPSAGGDFLGLISHELRTPLSAILGWSQVLERGRADLATLQHGLAVISRNARLQVQLLEELLDISHIESGRLRLDRQCVDLDDVIATAIDRARPAARAKGVDLRAVPGSRPGAVHGDAARLQQVVGHLLSNAVKFTPPGGRVGVALARDGDHARITVSDDGQGIDPAFLPQVFERFRQQDPRPARRHGGLGLGLTLVRHLVELHQGTVAVHSAGPDRGATFTVTLPTGAPQAGAPPAPSPARLDGVTVLLVDDEPDLRTATECVLQAAGARVLSAASAEEGLGLLRRHQPTVILSDIAMPGLDGHELMRRVRALPPSSGGETPAAAFTAYARPEDRQRVLAAGYQAHLVKPVQPAELVRAVGTLAGCAPDDPPPASPARLLPSRSGPLSGEQHGRR